MCGRSRMMRGAGFGPRRETDFLGIDMRDSSPGSQVAASLAVLAPVALSGLALVVFAPGMWWIFTTYFWVAFPAFGLLVRGIAGLADALPARTTAEARERELLGALDEYGELSPARAAAETSLTVAEAERKLRELAEGGHLEVRVRGGGIFYALWGAPSHQRAAIRGEVTGKWHPRSHAS